MPYLGGVVKLSSKDDFKNMTWVIKNLPVSGFDHAVNGVDFLHDRRLIVAVGGMTNAGWPSVKYGDIGESPLSGSIVAADVSKPGFDGTIKYNLAADTPEVHPHLGITNDRVADN